MRTRIAKESSMRSLLISLAISAALCLAPAAASADVTLKMAGQYAIEHTTTELMQEFAKAVEERTGGEVKVRVFPANQLGDYTQVFEELRRGTIDIATISVPSQFDTRLEVIYLHYLAMDYDEARRIYAPGSRMFKLMEEINDGLGIKFLAFNVEGFGGFGTIRKPDNIFDPKAAKNFLMRVPPMAVFQIPCEDEGFQTVSIPFAELYTALQTGVADGWSGGPAMVNFVQFRDVIKNFIVNNNFFENTSYLMSKQSWEKLTEAQRAILQEEALKISAKSFDLAQENDSKYLVEMEAAGIEVVRFDKAQLQAWADWCREATWKKMEERLTKEVIDALLADYK
jgi:TRAP-type C4-dicarboxylate transport system substrate-binding protein